jgi:type II secretory pathway pseudopilin PulG
MKKSLFILEIIFVLLILSIILSLVTSKLKVNKLKLAKNQLIRHLKYTRYVALLDDKYEHNNSLWYRKSWNLKFLNCSKNIGGIYYVIYSNTINTNHWAVSKEETLKDPLTNNYIYSFQCKKDNNYDKSKFVLLSEYYGIKKIKLSCNNTKSLGQLFFLNDGSVYTNFNSNKNDMGKYKLKETCQLILEDEENNIEKIYIEPNTGYIY